MEAKKYCDEVYYELESEMNRLGVDIICKKDIPAIILEMKYSANELYRWEEELAFGYIQTIKNERAKLKE